MTDTPSSDAIVHPPGSAQVLSAAAIGILALLVAFIGFVDFNSASAGIGWRWRDLPPFILALIGAIALVRVPWLATTPVSGDMAFASMQAARRSLMAGAVLALLAMVTVVSIPILSRGLGNGPAILRAGSVPVSGGVFLTITGLCISSVAALLMALYPPRVLQLDADGRPIVHLIADVKTESVFRGRLQRVLSGLGPRLLVLGFALQLVAAWVAT